VLSKSRSISDEAFLVAAEALAAMADPMKVSRLPTPTPSHSSARRALFRARLRCTFVRLWRRLSDSGDVCQTLATQPGAPGAPVLALPPCSHACNSVLRWSQAWAPTLV